MLASEDNLKAIQDAKRDVQDFSEHISSVEDTVNSEKGNTDVRAKQVTLHTNKLDELENHSHRSKE